MKKYFIVAILFFISGCASYEAMRQPLLYTDLIAQASKVNEKDVELMVKIFHKEKELEQYFDLNLIEYGVLPVQINLVNKGNETLIFERQSISLVNTKGYSSPPFSLEQVCEKGQKSYWRIAPWTIGFGLFGLIPSIINVSNTNNKIRADYESKIVQFGNLVPGAMVDGFLFFPINEEVNYHRPCRWLF